MERKEAIKKARKQGGREDDIKRDSARAGTGKRWAQLYQQSSPSRNIQGSLKKWHRKKAQEKRAQEKRAQGKKGTGKKGTKCRLGKNGTYN